MRALEEEDGGGSGRLEDICIVSTSAEAGHPCRLDSGIELSQNISKARRYRFSQCSTFKESSMAVVVTCTVK